MTAATNLIEFIGQGLMTAFQSPVLLGLFVFIVLMLWILLQRLPMAVVLSLSVPITYFLQTVDYNTFFPLYVLNLIVIGGLIALAIWSKISK